MTTCTYPDTVTGSTTPTSGIVALPARRVRTHGDRSLWLQDALDGREPHDHPAFEGHANTDVCIIGGGFTGLWTALQLKERAPGTDVTLVEADICGAGASGRNGGFALTWWAHFEHLVSLCGPEAALQLAQRAEQRRTAASATSAASAAEFEDAFSNSGWVWAATNPAQVGDWEKTVQLLDELGARPYQHLTRTELAELTGSHQHLDGLFEAVLRLGAAREARTRTGACRA